MNKRFLYLLLGCVAIISVSLYISCITDGVGEEDDGTEVPYNTITEEPIEQPEIVNILIDNSGSMKGYFNEENMTAMTRAIKSFRSFGKNIGTVQFIGDKIPFDESKSTVATILAKSSFNKDTDMASLVNEAVNFGGDSVPVIILTDGIVSTPQGKNDLAETEDKIERVLMSKGSDLGWMIFRGSGNYNGTYYIEADRPKSYPKINLKTESRPFFGLVIGPKAQIRYIEKDTEEKQVKWENEWNCEWVAFNTHDSHINLQFHRLDNTYFFIKDSQYFFKRINGEENEWIPLIFDYPTCLQERVKKLKPSNATLELNGKVIKQWKIEKVDKNTAQIAIKALDFEVPLVNENNLSLSFSTSPENEWIENYSSQNDKGIATDSIEQEKTYELSSLINPMTIASSNTDVNVTFSFQN